MKLQKDQGLKHNKASEARVSKASFWNNKTNFSSLVCYKLPPFLNLIKQSTTKRTFLIGHSSIFFKYVHFE